MVLETLRKAANVVVECPLIKSSYKEYLLFKCITLDENEKQPYNWCNYKSEGYRIPGPSNDITDMVGKPTFDDVPFFRINK